MNIPSVKVHCVECRIEFNVGSDDECLIAWEGCFCSEECRQSNFDRATGHDHDDDFLDNDDCLTEDN